MFNWKMITIIEASLIATLIGFKDNGYPIMFF